MRLRTTVPAALSAAALLLLPACGGDTGGDSADTATSSGSSSAAEPTDAPDDDADAAEFCTRTPEISRGVSDALDAAPEDFGNVPTVLADAVEQFGELDPPAEVADSFQATLTALEQVSTAAGSVDLTTPEGRQQFEDQASPVLAAATTDFEAVDTWITENCGTPAPAS